MLGTSIQHRNGFSFVELVIVVLMMGIFAAAAVPRYSESVSRYRAEAGATRIAADLEYAKNDAQAKSTSRTVSFVVGDDTYSVANLRDLDSAATTYNVDLSDEGSACQIASADFAGGNAVTFDWYGQANAAGTVVVQSSGHSYTVGVTKAGRIEVLP